MDNVSDGPEDFLPTAVRDGQVETILIVLLGPTLGVFNRVDHFGGQEVSVPEDAHADFVAMNPVVVAHAPKVLREEMHQMLHFLVLPSEVLGREGVDRQDSHPDLEAPFEDLLELVAPLHMPVQDVPKADLPSEPAVSIHDDRDMVGHRRLPDLMEKPTFVCLIRRVAHDLRDIGRQQGRRRGPTYLSIRGQPRIPSPIPWFPRADGRQRDSVFANRPPTRKPLSMLLNSCTQFLSSFNVV